MILPSDKYLMIDDYIDDNITIKKVDKKPFISSTNIIEYYDDGEYENLDYVMIIDNKSNIVMGYFIGTDIKNPEVKAFAGINDLLYVIKEFVCDREYIDYLFNFLSKLAIARECIYSIVSVNKNNYSFYEYSPKNCDKQLVDGYYIYYNYPYIKVVCFDDKEIRKAYIGEEYDIGKGAATLYKDSNYLGYIESEDMKYSYDFDYIVGYDKKINDYFGYLIGCSYRETDDSDNTYNAYYIKDFFIYTDENEKIDHALNIINYVIDISKHRSCKYLKIKITDNKLYYPFYEFCKEHLNMFEDNKYLIKKI